MISFGNIRENSTMYFKVILLCRSNLRNKNRDEIFSGMHYSLQTNTFFEVLNINQTTALEYLWNLLFLI